MDSWSRPSKSQATPPPHYLLPGGVNTPFCRSCGRVIGDRKNKTASTSQTPAKYCSNRCKNTKHNTPIDQHIEQTFLMLLNGQAPDSSTFEPQSRGGEKKAKKKKKGETRILVECSEVESLVFGERNADPEKRFGRKKNRKKRGVKDGEVWKSVDMVSDEEDEGLEGPTVDSTRNIPDEDKIHSSNSETETETSDDGVPIPKTTIPPPPNAIENHPDMVPLFIRSGTRIRPAQELSHVNGGIGGEKSAKERGSETENLFAKRIEGQKKAEERELVRCAARRGVAFGFGAGGDGETRLCEAVMKGAVVEASLAKGEWGIRWRE